MEFLKAIFGDKALTFDEFSTAIAGNKDVKFANLASGQYVEKDKYENLKLDLAVANKKIGELSESVKTLEGNSEQLTTLKNQIAEFEKAEKDRKEAEEKQAAEAAMLANYEAVVKDKKFVNDFTKTAIFEACKTELAKPENKGKGVSDVFAELTKDKPGIFASGNPQFNYGNAQDMSAGGEMTLEAFEKLNLMEQMQFARKYPADYERLTKMTN